MGVGVCISLAGTGPYTEMLKVFVLENNLHTYVMNGTSHAYTKLSTAQSFSSAVKSKIFPGN